MPNRIPFAKFLTIVLVAVLGMLPTQLVADAPIDFKTQVMPVLTKLGCNAGSCHGAATGRGNFRLSLYGSRPEDDFRSIVREGKGRRINRADIDRSLILRKPGGELDHGGDQRFELDDEAGILLANWIRQGAKFSDELSLVDLDVDKSPLVLKPGDSTIQFRFFATFSDGTRREVTRWTALTTNDSTSVSIDSETNVARIHLPGRHIVIVRYLNQVKSVELLVPYYDQVAPNKWNNGDNFVDDFVFEKLNQLGIVAAEPTDDASFIRRVTIDLTGRLPTSGRTASFCNDKSEDKRARLIQSLLASNAFTDYWTYQISEQLRIRSQPNDAIGARAYYDWLRNQIANHQSWNGIVREMLMSSGDSHETGQANFFRTTGDARLQTEFITESLMGIRLRCANCHDHPLDHWTQDDYHGLAAIFARVKQARFVSLNPQGENINARTGVPAMPRVPGEFFIDNEPSDHRLPFVSWLLDDTNPYFARAMVNRIWESLMGRGLVEPVDDLRSTNPATHPALLKRLADDFVKHDFDIRKTIAQICTSQAYQRSRGRIDAPEFHRRFYANASVRALSPEVLADAICDITGIREDYPGQPPGTRAVQLFDSRIPSKSLDVLGRCSRTESCESPSNNLMDGLSTQLHLLNGDLINAKIANDHSILNELVRANKTTNEIVKFFYTSAFGRQPSQQELDYWISKIEQEAADDFENARIQRLEDFVWSILNSKEFTTNH